jgi:UDP-N-acetylmuramoylalanine--D-glutamate ligase
LDLKGQTVLVLGLGATGLSASRWLKRRGAQIRVADSRDVPPMAEALAREFPGAELVTGEFRVALLQGVDCVVLSPGIAQTEPVVMEARRQRIPVAGDVELFAQALARIEAQSVRFGMGRPKVLAVTGTNGKSTVTAMAGALCREAGLNTVIAGNIGLPVLDALIEHEDKGRLEQIEVFVLELSSFQLETTESLDADAATVLNVTEDHLDRYPNINAYSRAKARIFAGDGVQVLNREDPRSSAMVLGGRRVLSFGSDVPKSEAEWGIFQWQGETWLGQGRRNLMPLRELPLAGLQNVLNALAALALCRALSLPYAPMLEALNRFKGLPHRVQQVATISGVTFYDDSKGTNVGATAAALAGFSQPVVLIAGGDGKGQNFAPLKSPVKRRARAVVLIGRDRERIAQALAGSEVPLSRAETMQEAVSCAFSEAQRGDAVLLSPACASFDMYRNYEQRGQAFIAAVESLKNGHDRAA